MDVLQKLDANFSAETGVKNPTLLSIYNLSQFEGENCLTTNGLALLPEKLLKCLKGAQANGKDE